MKRLSLLRLLLVAGIVASISGCATVAPKHEPAAFAPTYPIAAEPEAPKNGGLYQVNNSMNLFQDGKAYRVGDLLTVVLQENTNAQKQASTSTSKDQSISMGAPNLFGGPVQYNGRDILSANVNQGNEFSGAGSTTQSNSLRGNVTVFVSQVLPNGNLVVRGEKQLTLNQGSEYVRFSGIVRPSDISPNNTVPSTRVANAEILYHGEGAMADANRMGWLARFFNGPLWPF
ncbi:MAG: flagellar basal body L-ring protein FlgH [Chromatiales bacterium]|nr:flagellar basal body L-ring protein FlgH [Gammaproteobacteria bacterium]MBW6476631.1 flagellar basal body L-ring protein FlgH [Chromatiales bacterium]